MRQRPHSAVAATARPDTAAAWPNTAAARPDTPWPHSSHPAHPAPWPGLGRQRHRWHRHHLRVCAPHCTSPPLIHYSFFGGLFLYFVLGAVFLKVACRGSACTR